MYTNNDIVAKLQLRSAQLAAAVFLLGLLVITGWALNIEFFKRPIPGLVAMNPATAVCFIGCALSFLAAKTEHRRTALFFATAVLLIALIKLLRLSAGQPAYVDTFLFSEKIKADIVGNVSNSMAPNTAAGFLLSSLSLLTFASTTRNKLIYSQTLAAAVFILSFLSITGYLYQVREFYGVLAYIPMAVHTAAGFFLLSLALLFSSPETGIMKIISTRHTGGKTARILLPVSILVPLVLGAFRIYGERAGYFSSEMGLMLFVTIVMMVLALTVLIISYRLNEESHKTEEVKEKLRTLNAQLELKVEERTRELRKSEEQLRHTMDNMLEGAQIIGFDWKYKYVNDTLVRHSKYSREELIGHTVQEKYPGIETTPTYAHYLRCFEKREAFHVENEFRFPDGSVGWFELSFQPVPEGIFILSIDITERKKAENKIKQLNQSLEQKVIKRTAELAAANKELEAFSYSVSHDLRAPLRAVNGYSDMLNAQYKDQLDDNAKRLLGVIKTNALNMGQLIDDLLQFSRTGRKEVVPAKADMKKMVETIFSELVKTSQKPPPAITVKNIPPAYCDAQLMQQVWANLVSNAIKYTSKKENPQIEVGSDEKENETHYYIKDNGAGFDMQYASKLFGVFQRMHSHKEFEGNGVGLALVQRIINKHGGKVWAEAELEKGATFYFTLKNNLSDTSTH